MAYKILFFLRLLIGVINLKEIGERLKETRESIGISIEEAAEDLKMRPTQIESIESAKDIYQAAKAMAELAEKTYTRIQNLYDSGVVSLQKRDEAETNYKSAKFNENTAYQQYKIALDGATKETKEALRQKELAALGTLDEVESYAKDAQAFSPISGEVSNILLHTNELAPSGFPVVLVIDTNNAYLKSNETISYLPIRGGTDGATITYMGLPCPNLGTGGYNAHGKFELVSLTQMNKMIEILKNMLN